VRKKAHTSIQVQSEHSGIPCAVVLRLISRSPRRRIPLASVAAGLKAQANPGRASQDLRRLDASNGRQDHTVLPSAAMLSSGALCSLTETSALQTSCAPGIAAATASRTLRPWRSRYAPLAGRDGRDFTFDLPDGL